MQGVQTSPEDELQRGNVSSPLHNDQTEYNTALCQNNHPHVGHSRALCKSLNLTYVTELLSKMGIIQQFMGARMHILSNNFLLMEISL